MMITIISGLTIVLMLSCLTVMHSTFNVQQILGTLDWHMFLTNNTIANSAHQYFYQPISNAAYPCNLPSSSRHPLHCMAARQNGQARGREVGDALVPYGRGRSEQAAADQRHVPSRHLDPGAVEAASPAAGLHRLLLRHVPGGVRLRSGAGADRDRR